MAYDLPTAADFKARFPIFTDTPDALINQLITEASANVDQSWEEPDYKPAILYLAAHLLALDNSQIGDTVEVGGGAGIASESFGGMSISYAQKSGSLSSSEQFGGTIYGQRYLTLLRRNRGGPLVV